MRAYKILPVEIKVRDFNLSKDALKKVVKANNGYFYPATENDNVFNLTFFLNVTTM